MKARLRLRGLPEKICGGGFKKRPVRRGSFMIPAMPRPTAKPTREDPAMLAAIDLGSNSFRMVIARVVGDIDLRPVDQLREGVQLAAYLDEDRNIRPEGRERALACLRVFGQRLRDFPQSSVRAVGTNTLRKAHDAEDFLVEAEEALGFPIEVISGREEARLIYLGASHSLPETPGKRLVVDIGGGSTECIVGQGPDPVVAESLYMGCVSHTLAYFENGRISERAMKAAETAARLELRSVKSAFRKIGWDEACGSSGTALAIADIVRLSGWGDAITAEGLAKLRKAVLARGHVDELAFPSLRRDRARVLPAGLAILSVIFDTFKIDKMVPSAYSLREGVLFDLLGRLRHEDMRDRTIQRLCGQYQVDLEQAERVEKTALAALAQVAGSWRLDPEVGEVFLRWAAKLHEIGLSIAHSGFHKHGAYLLEFSDLPGFSVQDQRLLALLVGGQRRRLRKEKFAQLQPKSEARQALRLCLLLRLAILMNRSRSRREPPALKVEAKGRKMTVSLPADYLGEHPLTEADLGHEAQFLAAAGYTLEVRHA